MPCNTIQTTTVEFLSKSTDIKLLKRALESIGYYVTETAQGLTFSHQFNRMSGFYDKTTGRMNARGSEKLDIDEVKRAYGKQVVIQTAKQEGWQLSWSTNEAGNEVAAVQKAMY